MALGKKGRALSAGKGLAKLAPHAAAAGYAGKKVHDKVKKSSALETLVEARAVEMLEENGIDIEKIAEERVHHFGRAPHANEKAGREAGRTMGARGGAGAGALGGAVAAFKKSAPSKGGGLKAHALKAGLTAAGAAGGALSGAVAGRTLGGAAGHLGGSLKGHEKKSSALDTLVELRAQEILAENGIELEQEEVEQEKVAGDESEYDVLAEVVEAQAIALLEANGFEFTTDEE
jgi:hypothetical protein